jgi:L-lactate permease
MRRIVPAVTPPPATVSGARRVALGFETGVGVDTALGVGAAPGVGAAIGVPVVAGAPSNVASAWRNMSR